MLGEGLKLFGVDLRIGWKRGRIFSVGVIRCILVLEIEFQAENC